jgi:hypothetical protein
VTDPIAPEVQAFIDRAQIKAVLVAYCRAIDRLDMDLLRSCYTPDGTDDRGLFKGGIDEFVPYVQQHVGSMIQTMHYVTNVHIELGDGTAKSECYIWAYHRLKSRAAESGLSDLFLGARFLDEWQRASGRWRIKARRVIWDWSRLDALTRTWNVPASALLPARDINDPSYRHCAWNPNDQSSQEIA